MPRRDCDVQAALEADVQAALEAIVAPTALVETINEV
jgi:hypothetical protein